MFCFVEQLVLEHNMWCHYFQEKLSDFLTDKTNPKIGAKWTPSLVPKICTGLFLLNIPIFYCRYQNFTKWPPSPKTEAAYLLMWYRRRYLWIFLQRLQADIHSIQIMTPLLPFWLMTKLPWTKSVPCRTTEFLNWKKNYIVCFFVTVDPISSLI